MKRHKIFLSYRRDDSPGYVSRLEDELERAFGDDRVFRDATDIPGGTKWRNVIDANLHSAAVLILFIGPRWEEIWVERKDAEVNYVALELRRAKELDVPIIPLTLNGTELSNDLDLGDIAFIRDSQFHDISDRQGRWKGDFARLVSLLEGYEGIGKKKDSRPPPSPPAPEKKSGGLGKVVGAVAVVLLALFVWTGIIMQPDPDPPLILDSYGPEPAEPGNDETDRVVPVKPDPEPEPPPAMIVPDISGTWQGADETIYFVIQYDDGTFDVESPGYGSGTGRFLPGMPNKFEIVMHGIGRGEFAVSTTGERATGWIVVDGQQEFDTLVRVD
ncbi:MAG: toll/interleukin-1 receptor domain-containing protein [Pseudomonadota bacterium]